jgi:hypothetical protein
MSQLTSESGATAPTKKHMKFAAISTSATVRRTPRMRVRSHFGRTSAGRCAPVRVRTRRALTPGRWTVSASGVDALSLFGLVAVTAMLAFYALEDRSAWYVLAFAAACGLGSVYGFLQGAWPFGLVEAVWAGVAVRRWRARARFGGTRAEPQR